MSLKNGFKYAFNMAAAAGCACVAAVSSLATAWSMVVIAGVVTAPVSLPVAAGVLVAGAAGACGGIAGMDYFDDRLMRSPGSLDDVFLKHW